MSSKYYPNSSDDGAKGVSTTLQKKGLSLHAERDATRDIAKAEHWVALALHLCTQPRETSFYS